MLSSLYRSWPRSTAQSVSTLTLPSSPTTRNRTFPVGRLVSLMTSNTRDALANESAGPTGRHPDQPHRDNVRLRWSHLFESSDEWASTGASNAMKSTQATEPLQEALCGNLAGPYA